MALKASHPLPLSVIPSAKRRGSDSGGWHDGWNSNTEAQKETEQNRFVTVNPLGVKKKEMMCVTPQGALLPHSCLFCADCVSLLQVVSQAESSIIDD